MSRKNFSPNLRKCLREIQTLLQIKDQKIQKQYLKYLSKQSCIYDAVHEIALNITANKIPLTPTEAKKLKKYRNVFKKLSKKTKEKSAQSRQVIQAGGAFPLLIPILGSIGGAIKLMVSRLIIITPIFTTTNREER